MLKPDFDALMSELLGSAGFEHKARTKGVFTRQTPLGQLHARWRVIDAFSKRPGIAGGWAFTSDSVAPALALRHGRPGRTDGHVFSGPFQFAGGPSQYWQVIDGVVTLWTITGPDSAVRTNLEAAFDDLGPVWDDIANAADIDAVVELPDRYPGLLGRPSPRPPS